MEETMPSQKTNSPSINKDSPIILVGGGTGGHIFPLVAIGEALKERRQGFLYIGSPKSREEEVIGRLNWPFLTVEAGKWRRYVNLKAIGENLGDVVKTIKGFFQSLSIIRKNKVRLVIGKGGYVSLPVILAAKFAGCKIIVHESDTVMGLSNRIAARFANKILTNFPVSVFPFADQRFVQVGMPIRRSLRQAAKLKAPQKERPLLLVLPGSQGSLAINAYIKAELANLLQFTDIVHLTGEKDFPLFKNLAENLPSEDRKYYRPYQFIDRELPYYFRTADLLVARASATTIAEAALFRRALYLVPLPSAASNHQVINARFLANGQSAVVKEQYQLTSEIFVHDIKTLIEDGQKLKDLGERLHNYFSEDEALTKIMSEIEQLLNGGRGNG